MQILLSILFLAITTYTSIVGFNQGWNIFSVVLHDISSMSWSGQFNLDFSMYLILSALWIAWKNQYSVKGISIALMAGILGMAFFSPYILI